MNIDDERELFSESQSRAIVEVSSENAAKVEKLLKESGLHYEEIGSVSQKDIMLNSISLSKEELHGVYFNSFNEMINQDL